MTIKEATRLYRDARARWQQQGGSWARTGQHLMPRARIIAGQFAGLSGPLCCVLRLDDGLVWGQVQVGHWVPGRAPHMGNTVYVRPAEIEEEENR